MSTSTLVWVFLLAAAILALWVIARFPDRRPHSLVAATLLFLAAQLVPQLGLAVLPGVMRLRHGAQLALAGVVLPAFFVLCLTLGWLLLAISDAIGGPRGGHRVRHDRAHRALG